MARLILVIGLIATLGGCAVAVGAVGAVAVDEAMEREQGGDGLF